MVSGHPSRVLLVVLAFAVGFCCWVWHDALLQLMDNAHILEVDVDTLTTTSLTAIAEAVATLLNIDSSSVTATKVVSSRRRRKESSIIKLEISSPDFNGVMAVNEVEPIRIFLTSVRIGRTCSAIDGALRYEQVLWHNLCSAELMVLSVEC